MKRLLAFSDAHVSPGQDLERFDWLGKLIVDVRPDAVWNGGDFATCDSVSFFKVPREDQYSLAEEAEAVRAAHARMWRPLQDLNDRRKASKHGPIVIHKMITMGNHEHRIKRRCEDDELGLGSVVTADNLFQYSLYYDQVADWKEYIEYEGLLLTHCPINGRGKPMDGIFRGRHIALQSEMPILYGHTHRVDYTVVNLMGPVNKTRSALNLPCFLDQDHVEKYAKGSASGWDYGVVLVDIYEPGRFTFKWISMGELRHKYSEKKS